MCHRFARSGHVWLRQCLMQERYRHAALADGRRHALDRTAANVSDREDARHARFEEKRVAGKRAYVARGIQTG